MPASWRREDAHGVLATRPTVNQLQAQLREAILALSLQQKGTPSEFLLALDKVPSGRLHTMAINNRMTHIHFGVVLTDSEYRHVGVQLLKLRATFSLSNSMRLQRHELHDHMRALSWETEAPWRKYHYPRAVARWPRSHPGHELVSAAAGAHGTGRAAATPLYALPIADAEAVATHGPVTRQRNVLVRNYTLMCIHCSTTVCVSSKPTTSRRQLMCRSPDCARSEWAYNWIHYLCPVSYTHLTLPTKA